MINRFSLFLGGLGLFALQGCKTQQGEQAQLPNVIYVFPTSTVIRLWSSGDRMGFATR